MPLVASCHRNWDKLQPHGPLLARMQTLPYISVDRKIALCLSDKESDSDFYAKYNLSIFKYL